jgi:N-acetylmuramoyl-L-alanine amidase
VKTVATPPPTQTPKASAPAQPRVEPIFVGRVVDESVAETESDTDADTVAGRVARVPVMVGVLLTVLVITAVWNYRRLVSRGQQQQTKSVPASVAQPPAALAPTLPATESAPPNGSEKALTEAVSLRSAEGNATVTIQLPKAIRFEGYQLANPDRIYFDLHDVKLADAKGNVFDSEGLISHVRLSNYAAGVTRVVFDLRQPATFSAKLVEQPERLVIEIRRAERASKATGNDLGLPTKVTIVIDPGHGGKDLGTVSPSGLQEKDLTLDVAERLGTLLKKRLGARVIFTRDKDVYVSLDQRANIANQAHANLMISIHGNSSNVQTVRGVETYYFREPMQGSIGSNETEMAERFAADVHRALIHGLTAPRQPMRDRGVREASFVVLREAQMPAALAEISFISNLKDQPQLESDGYRQRIALALYRGIADHIAHSEPQVTASGMGMHTVASAP